MKAGVLSLLLSAVALGAAVFSLTRETPTSDTRSSARTNRVAQLEQKVQELTRELDAIKARTRTRMPADGGAPDADPAKRAFIHDSDAEAKKPGGKSDLEAVVDAAVDRKTKRVLDELRVKANKKPEFAAFASVLELTVEQKAVTQRVVADGQRQVYEILDTPTSNGTNLLDELVEIAARDMAEPGKDHGWGRWLARVIGEKIPGTNETYGTRLEAVKQQMNAAFKKTWSADQFREYTEWQVDPAEIEEVPGSPYDKLGKRIVERARDLGAEVDDDGKPTKRDE